MPTLGDRLRTLARVAQEEFGDLLDSPPLILDDRIRLLIRDGSFLEIRYPLKSKYSFYWQREKQMYRFNTAAHHKEIATFPRHLHNGREDQVEADHVTSLDSLPEENLRNVLTWVRQKLTD